MSANKHRSLGRVVADILSGPDQAKRRRTSYLRRLQAERLEDRNLLAHLTFDPLVTLPIAGLGSPGDVAVGNLKEDAYPDIIASYNTGSYPYNPDKVAIFNATGPATYPAPATYTSFPQCWGASVNLADLNADGHTDLVMTHGGSNSLCFGNKVSAHLGSGTGTFAQSQVISTGGSLERTVIGSFNSNTNATPDIVVPTFDSNQMYFHSGNGDGTFAAGSGVGGAPADLKSYDFNGDGRLDLATIDTNPPQFQLLSGNGAGGFSVTQGWGAARGGAIELADMNNDSRMDVVAMDAGNRVLYVLLGQAGGTFGAPASFATGLSQSLGNRFKLADLDLDGDQDVVFGSPGLNTLYTMLGDGAGNLGAPTAIGSATSIGGSLSVADLNQDGKPDIVATYGNSSGGGVSYLLNRTVNVETEVQVVGGQMLVTDVVVGGKADGITLTQHLSGGSQYVRVNDPSHLVHASSPAIQINDHTVDVLLTSITSIQVDTGAGTDKLTIDYNAPGGVFAIPISYNAGTELDGLDVTGGAFTNVAFNYDSAVGNSNAQSGTINQDGIVISYTGLEPIKYYVSVGNYAFNLPGTGDNAVLENDTPSPSQANVLRLQSQAASATFELTDFTPPSVSAVINLGADAATFTVAASFAGETFPGSLTINGGLGADAITVDPSIVKGTTLNGNGDGDTLTGGAGIDTIDGGTGDDVIRAQGSDAQFDVLQGGLGTDQLVNTGAGDMVLAQFNLFSDVFDNSIEELHGGGGNVVGNTGGNELHFGFTKLVNVSGEIKGVGGDDDVTTSFSNNIPNNYPSGVPGPVVVYDGGGQVSGDHITVVLTPVQLASLTTAEILTLQAYLLAPTGQVLNVLATPDKGNLRAIDFESANLAVYDDGVILDATNCILGIVSEDQIIVGTDGSDVIYGTNATDLIFGQGGADTIYGLDGDDCLFGGAGNDAIFGGNMNDLLLGGSGDDSLFGEIGYDRLVGGTGADQLDGALHDDELDGGPGQDTVLGGPGYDIIKVRLDEASTDIMNGGDNTDTIVNDRSAPVVLAGFDGSVSSVEGWVGNNQPILGTDAANVLSFLVAPSYSMSLSGVPYIDGRGGNDTITGTNGVDDLRGGEGNDSLYGFGGVDRLYGDAGDDSLNGGDGVDYLYGGDGVDTITTGAGRDFVYFAGDLASLDVISDFALYSDTINLQAYGVTYAALGFDRVSIPGSTIISVPNLPPSKKIRLLNWNRVVGSSQFKF